MTPLRVDPAQWATGFGRTPFSFEHTLDDERLLLPDRVAALAGRLPDERVEHHVGAVDAVTLDGAAPRLDLPAGEIARRIEDLRCWMMLRNVESDPAYASLLDACFAQLRGHLGDAAGGMRHPEGYLFYSAAGSVTPAHLDSEHNFLCHIRGTKEVVVGTYPDDRTAQLKAERKYRGGQRNLDMLPHDPTTFRLEPGHGVYIPPLTPHWVRTGDDVCVSLAVTFRTRESMRRERVHAFNGVLRGAGLDPRPPGRRPWIDEAKATVVATWQRRPDALRNRRGR